VCPAHRFLDWTNGGHGPPCGWKENGGTLAAIFSSMGTYSKWGSWGLLEYHGQPTAEAPKYQSVLEFLAANPKWW
jgi:hypothetical protein